MVTSTNEYTQAELFNRMVTRTPILIGAFYGVIQSIELEDGSGNCFNVKLAMPNHVKQVCFVRTK